MAAFAASGVERSRRCGKVGRMCSAGQISITRLVQDEHIAGVGTDAAEIGGVEERRSGGVQFGNESVSIAAKARLEGSGRDGKVLGLSPTGYVSDVAGVDADGKRYIVSGAPQKRGIDQGRAGSIDLGNKAIAALSGATAAFVSGLESSWRNRI